MPAMPDALLAYLEGLGIAATTTEHPPLFTVADSQALRGTIAGAHTKNLFLKDRKDHYFLITAEEEAVIDLKTIHVQLGAAGRVSFGKPEVLFELLGVTPGAVTMLGLLNDKEARVEFFIDETLLGRDVINVHPLTNTATTSLLKDDLLRFVAATGHVANVLKLS